MRIVKAAFLCLVAGSLCVTAQAGDEVSRQPPELYASKIAPLLMPLNEVLKSREKAPGDNDGVVLLNETLHWVTPEGGRILVEHVVSMANTEAGAAALAQHSNYFRKTITKPHVALAQTILPDGRRLSVDGNGMLLHSPQPDADAALYADNVELRLVFPGVKPGVITESIVVMEQSELILPGELMTEMMWTSIWPTQNMRLIVSAPDVLGSRLRVVPVGMSAPPAVPLPHDEGRVTLRWSSTDLPVMVPEPQQPSFMQTGPLLAVTTLREWSDIARWFHGLAQERSKVPAAMLQEIGRGLKKGAPADASARRALLTALMRKVADDVRYTGLEFGVGAYQPREPEQVWATRYGDCKDKSNLLRVLLENRGVKSWLALVNTHHDGRVPRECPSVRWFNHVVLAVDDGAGGLVWCDPTIKEGPPGVLGGGVGDRDVLLVRDDGVAEWVRTPPEDKGLMTYETELKPRAEGGWSGWLMMTGSGLSGTGMKTYFDKIERTQALSLLRTITEGIMPHAELIDYKKETPPAGATYALKVFLDVPGMVTGPVELRPPHVGWAQDFTRLKTRQTDFYQDLQRRSVTLRYLLPEGQAPAQLPAPVRLKTPGFMAEAQWTADAKAVTAKMTWDTPKNVIVPDDYSLCHTSAQMLAAWTDKVVPLVASGASPRNEPRLADDLATMPTGEGQLALIDRRYPPGGNAALRRAALQRVPELYPREHTAVFASQVLLASVDLSERKGREASARLRETLARLGGKVTADEVAWAEQLLVSVLQFEGRKEEALALANKIFEQQDVSEQRRALVALLVAEQAGEGGVARATEVLRQAVMWQTPSAAAIFDRLTRLLAESGDDKGIEEVIRKLHARGAGQLHDALATLPLGTAELAAHGKVELATRWLDAIEKALPAESRASVKTVLSQARAQLDGAQAGERIRTRLAAFFQGGGLPGWDRTEAAYPAGTPEALLASFNRLMQAGLYQEALGYGAQRLVRYKADELQAAILSQMVEAAYAAKSIPSVGPGLFDELLTACEMLPKTHETYLDARIKRAESEREAHPEKAEALLREVLATGDLPHDAQLRSTAALSLVCQSRGRLDEAVELGESLLPDLTNPAAYNGLVRAVLIHIQRGDHAKACALADKLRGSSSLVQSYLTGSDSVRELLKLTEDRAAAAAYWKSVDSWWPEWERFEKEAGLDTATMTGVPLLSSPQSIGVLIRQSLAADDRKAALRTVALMVHAARGVPLWTKEVASLALMRIPGLSNDLPALQQFSITMLKNSRYPDAAMQREADILRLALLTGSGRSGEGLALGGDLWKRCKPEEPVAALVARCWLLLAQAEKSEVDSAVAALSAALDGTAGLYSADRDFSVSMLSDALFTQRKFTDAARLLRRELADPAGKNSPSAEKWRKKLEALGSFTGDADEFGEEFKAWIGRQPRLAWLEFVEPKALTPEDLKPAQAAPAAATGSDKKAVEQASPGESQSVAIKKAYLVVTSKEASFERKLEAANLNLFRFLNVARRPARDISGWIREGLESRKMPEVMRGTLLRDAVTSALLRHDAAEAEALMAHPLFEKLTDNFKAIFGRRLRVEKCDVNSPEEIRKLAESFQTMQGERVWMGSSAWMGLLFRIIEARQFDLAESMLDHPGDMETSVDPAAPKEDPSVTQMKLLKSVRKERKLFEWAENIVASSFGPHLPPEWKLAPQPKELSVLASTEHIFLLDPDTTWSAWTWLAAHRPGAALDKKMIGEMLDFGGRFLWKGDSKPGIALASDVQRSEGGDAGRASVFEEIAWAMIDWHDPDARSAVIRALAPTLTSGRYPQCSSIIRQLEFEALVQTGKASAAAINKADPSTRLSIALATYSPDAIRAVLAGIPDAELLSDDLLHFTVRAYRICGLDAERRIAEQKARRLIQQAMVESWVTFSTSAIDKVLYLWTALDDPDVVPVAWSTQMAQFIESPYWRGMVLTRSATLRQDWPGALKHANALLNQVPSATSYEYDRAAALVHLGRRNEARKSLELFKANRANDPRMRQVGEWLNELDGK